MSAMKCISFFSFMGMCGCIYKNQMHAVITSHMPAAFLPLCQNDVLYSQPSGKTVCINIHEK